MKFRIFLALVVLGCVVYSAYVSHHGYRDLIELQKKVSAANDRIMLLEQENEDLKRRASLLEEPSEDLLERQVRDFLGWVKPTELVYIEKSAVEKTVIGTSAQQKEK